MSSGAFRRLRLVLAVALASGLTWVICHGVGLGSATPYGVVVAALFIRPGFDRWPPPVFVLLPAVVVFGLSLGTVLKPLLQAPQVWQFAVVTAIAQILGQALPDRLMMVRNLLALLAVLPLLGSNATWLGAFQQSLAVLVGMATATLLQAGLRLPQDAAPDGAEASEPKASALPSRSILQRFVDPYFWRKLVVSALALSIGLGVGAATPKYLYFGVVLLLNDSLGATLARVRDRMAGVSLGVLMPALVFNTMEINSVSVALVMGGTTALLLALRLEPHLSTALISSGVTFVGYGALTQWYIPNRWLDYLLGCGLALLVCLLVRPLSALARFQALARESDGLDAGMRALLPSAMEEARLLGQQRQFQQLVQRLESGSVS